MNFRIILSTLVTILLIVSCKNDPTSSTPVSPKTVTQMSTGGNSTTSSQVFPTKEDIRAVEQNIPVRGGPADFTIKINGSQPGRADLVGYHVSEHFLADTTLRTADGSMRFVNEEGFPQGLYFVKIDNERYLRVMLGKDQKFTLESTITNPDADAVVTGSDENSAYYENLAMEQTGNQKMQAINTRMTNNPEGSAEHSAAKAEQNKLLDERDAALEKLYKKYPNTLFEKFKRAGANPRVREDVAKEDIMYHYRQEFWDDVDFSDRRLARTPVITNKLKRYFEELTPQNQDSILASAYPLIDKTLGHAFYFKYFANWIVTTYEPGKCALMDPEKVHVNMIRKYFTKERSFWADSMTVYGLQNRVSEMSHSLMWEKGPDVNCKDLSGKTQRLFENDEDYIIVYLFTPDCENCKKETPKLVKWYNEQKAQGKSRDVYAIALESNLEDPNELSDYINKNNIPFTVVWDPTNRSIINTYYVNNTPELYVLNPDRYVVGKNLHTSQLDTMINRDIDKRLGK